MFSFHSFFRTAVLATFLTRAFALAPSDSYRDADVGQSSYVGGNHNMDPSVVDSPQFGQLWKIPFNDKEKFYAKPLVYTPLAGGPQILFLASSQNYIRTLDAKTGAVLNTKQVKPPFQQSDIKCTDIPDTIGIIGTPTIDPATDIAYFYAKTYIPDLRVPGPTGVENGVYYFYAVDVNTLNDVPGFPILVDGTPADNDARKYFIGGTVLQRPSLVQIGNVVYAGFGGHCDLFNYTGTVLGVDIVQKKVITNFATVSGPKIPLSAGIREEDGGKGGIWMGGLGLASDGARLFFVTGNGAGNENNGVPASGRQRCNTLGEATVNLNVADGGVLKLADYFQPYDYQNMDGGDQDFGSGGLSLLDPTVFKGTGVSHMAVTAGKNGKIYVLNADNLGGYKNGNGGTDLIVQTIVTGHSVFGGAGSYPLEGGYIYYTPVGYETAAYKLGHDASGAPQFIFAGQSNEKSAGRVGVGVPTVTTNQGKPGSGIVWMADPDAGIRAWYAVPGSDGKLKSIKMPQIGGANKFQRPAFGDTRLYITDANGVLYCLGSPVNLPLDCTSVDFGDVAIGSAKSATVNCTALININSIDGMTVGDARFEVSNATLPKGPVAKGTAFSFPVRWNLTTAVVQNTPDASYGTVTPGIKTTPLTLYTTNGVGGYATIFPLSLTGNQVSQNAYLSVSPITLDFGGLVLGVPGENPSSTLSLSIANLGSQDLTILGYAYTYDEPHQAGAVWTNSTYTNNTWALGDGFTSSNLPAVGSVFKPGQSQTVEATFRAVDGVKGYLSYFQVYSNGGKQFTILEGSASTAPVANFSISTSEGGWLDTLTMDFGSVAPGETVTRQIRICNSGGSVLTISKSKPPLSQIYATAPGVDLHESQTIAVNDCAYGTIAFSPYPEPPNIYDIKVTDSWTLNTDDLNFGVHVVNMIGTVHDRIVGPTYSNGTFRYTYMGCYLDAGGPRLLPVMPYAAGPTNDNANCQSACFAAGYAFAGTEYQTECYCGNTPPPGSRFYTEDQKKCTYSCANDATQACGGIGGYLSVYYDNSKFTPTNSTYNNIPPAAPVTAQSVGAYGYIGCYSEATNGRALTAKNVPPQDGMGGSVEWCAANCQGYTYFGVEFANECYCGNTINAGSTLMSGTTPSDTGCSMLCGGNATEYCGGGNRLNMYQLNAPNVKVVVSSSTSSAAASSTAISSSLASSNASSTAIASSTVSSSAVSSSLVAFNTSSAALSSSTQLSSSRAVSNATSSTPVSSSAISSISAVSNISSSTITSSAVLPSSTVLSSAVSSRLVSSNSSSTAPSSSAVLSSSRVSLNATSSSAVPSSAVSSNVVSSSVGPSSTVLSSSAASNISSTALPSNATRTALSSSTASSSAMTSSAISSSAVSSSTVLSSLAPSNVSSSVASSSAASSAVSTRITSSSVASSNVTSSSMVTSSAVSSSTPLSRLAPSNTSSTVPSSSAVSSSGTASSTVISSSASSTSVSSSSSATPTGPSVVPSVGSFVSIGCYNESATGRTISAKTYANDSMTVESCAAFCAGYTYMGVEYARECYCGNALRTDSGPASSGCTMVCAGNQYEYCGGGNRLNMYQVRMAVSSSASSIASSSSSSAVPSPSSNAVSSVSSSSAPIPSSSSRASTNSVATSSSPISSSAVASSSSVAASSSRNMASASSSSVANSTSSARPSSSASVVPSASSASSTVPSSTSSTSSSASASATALTCPGANSTTYTTVNGTYLIECYIDHVAGDIAGTGQSAATFQTCVDRCSATTGCVSFAWVPSGTGCYLKSTIGAANKNMGVWGGKLLPRSSSSSSAVPAPTAPARRRVRMLQA